jgi:hypothetical protein
MVFRMTILRSVGARFVPVAALSLLIFLLLASLGPFRPILMSDSAYGFLTWADSLRTGTINSFNVPDARDISRDEAEFVTWWSSGQYV